MRFPRKCQIHSLTFRYIENYTIISAKFTIYRIFEPNSELKLRILGLTCNIIYFTNYPHMHILKSSKCSYRTYPTLCFDIPSKNNPFICLIAISDSIFFEKTVIVYPASKQNPKISKMKVSLVFSPICIDLHISIIISQEGFWILVRLFHNYGIASRTRTRSFVTGQSVHSRCPFPMAYAEFCIFL